METGRDFLRAQINNAIMLHKALIEQLEDHSKQAEDASFRAACLRWIPKMEHHQHMLEEYGRTIGASEDGGIKKVFGAVLAKARDTVDAMRESDFLRVVGDTVMVRQAQDTFAAFADVGDRIGEPKLSEFGRTFATEHDEMQREFNELARQIFVDQVQGSPV